MALHEVRPKHSHWLLRCHYTIVELWIALRNTENRTLAGGGMGKMTGHLARRRAMVTIFHEKHGLVFILG